MATMLVSLTMDANEKYFVHGTPTLRRWRHVKTKNIFKILMQSIARSVSEQSVIFSIESTSELSKKWNYNLNWWEFKISVPNRTISPRNLKRHFPNIIYASSLHKYLWKIHIVCHHVLLFYFNVFWSDKGWIDHWWYKGRLVMTDSVTPFHSMFNFSLDVIHDWLLKPVADTHSQIDYYYKVSWAEYFIKLSNLVQSNRLLS
jgi:hypothetical protein